jgi:hypothetical protein
MRYGLTMQSQAGAMNMWAGLWAQIFDYFLLTD